MLTLGQVLEGDCEVDGGRLRYKPVGKLDCSIFGMPGLRDPTSAVVVEPHLARYVPKGQHRVGVIVQELAGTERAAFLVLDISEQPIARWELALTDHDARSLRAGHATGTKVESGTLVLFDAIANKSIRNDPLRAKLVEIASGSERAVRVSMVKLRTGLTSAVVVGTKNGTFQAYWALDATDEPVSLLVDLDIQDFEKPVPLLEAALDARATALARLLMNDEHGGEQRHALADVPALGWPRANTLLPRVEALLASADVSVRQRATLTLGELLRLHAPLLEEYRAIVESGDPQERLLAALVAWGRRPWPAKPGESLKPALLQHLSTTDPMILAAAIAAIGRQQAHFDAGEAMRYCESHLQHESPLVRSAALRAFSFELGATSRPSVDAYYTHWARADRALASPDPAERTTATEALSMAVHPFPAHQGRLLSLLLDPEPAVGFEAARSFVGYRSQIAPDLMRPVIQFLGQLAEDQKGDYQRVETAKKWLAELTGPSEPHASPARLIYFSPSYTLSEEAGGLLRLQGPNGLLFQVEQRRVFDIQARPDPERPGEAWLVLSGCFEPYGFQRVTTEGAWFGPFPSAEAEGMVTKVNGFLRLPARPLKVAFADLVREPKAFHAWFIESEGEWLRAHEVSTFAGAWLSPPAHWQAPAGSGALRVSVSGIWHANPDPTKGIRFGPSGGGYGHLGMAPAELEVYRIVPASPR